VCSCKTSNTAEAIYFAHSKSKRKFKSDEKERRLKENKEMLNTKFGGKQQRTVDLVVVGPINILIQSNL